jgi:NAD-dependent histone deacetylase SIR2
VRRVLQCHGSFATATCLQCRRRVPGKEIEADILRRKVPLCTVCNIRDTTTPQNKKGKRKGKKAPDKWDSDEDDESDQSEFPPGIMKVRIIGKIDIGA